MRKKILHIITGLEVGGAETNLSKIVPYIENIFESRVCCLKGEGQIGEKLHTLNIPVYYLYVNTIIDFFNPYKILKFRKIIKDFQPDIIETYLIHADIFGRVWGKFFGVKKIICNHRGSLLQWEWLSLIDKITSFLVTKYVFQTPTAQKKIIKKININLDRTAVIPNVIDLDIFNFDLDRDSKTENLKLKMGNLNIITVSNLRKGKGHKYLIEAFNNIFLKGYKNVSLIIVGDGNQKPALEKQVRELESKDNIYFLGKRNDVLEILKIGDIFVLPTFYEGMSNAIMEAMSSKLPIITTNIDVNKDLIRNGHSGILVPVKDSEAISNNLIKLMKNPQERHRLGQNAFKNVKENYSLNVVSLKIINLLESV